MSSLHRETDLPPYRVAVDARPEYRPKSSTEIKGYVARATIMRLDGSPVYERCLAYEIHDGEIFVDPEAAMRDAEQRAREDIRSAFPR